ncbi:MAG: type II toxin-antitoxin system Phd/YefM family antitoxin [Actinomycetia bacterium]|nr:type II toxin-antitoxin system Phd/YefM family antitoxin [Actinomycetes bacterium]
MSISITEDFKTISDLKKKTNEIFKQIHQTGRPVIITVNGKPNAVLLDVDTFEKKLKALNLGVLLLEAENDIRKGHIRPARVFLEEFKNSAKI